MSCAGDVPAVTFNYSDWVAIYPEFSNVPEPQAQNYFNMAGSFCSNRLGPVRNIPDLTTLLYVLTAHITALFGPKDGAAIDPNGLVGRINSATQGSVSVQSENNYPEGSVQWYQQTKYGALYWAMTTKYRTMHYRVPANRPIGTFGFPR